MCDNEEKKKKTPKSSLNNKLFLRTFFKFTFVLINFNRKRRRLSSCSTWLARCAPVHLFPSYFVAQISRWWGTVVTTILTLLNFIVTYLRYGSTTELKMGSLQVQVTITYSYAPRVSVTAQLSLNANEGSLSQGNISTNPSFWVLTTPTIQISRHAQTIGLIVYSPFNAFRFFPGPRGVLPVIALGVYIPRTLKTT